MSLITYVPRALYDNNTLVITFDIFTIKQEDLPYKYLLYQWEMSLLPLSLVTLNTCSLRSISFTVTTTILLLLNFLALYLFKLTDLLYSTSSSFISFLVDLSRQQNQNIIQTKNLRIIDSNLKSQNHLNNFIKSTKSSY